MNDNQNFSQADIDFVITDMAITQLCITLKDQHQMTETENEKYKTYLYGWRRYMVLLEGLLEKK